MLIGLKCGPKMVLNKEHLTNEGLETVREIKKTINSKNQQTRNIKVEQDEEIIRYYSNSFCTICSL